MQISTKDKFSSDSANCITEPVGSTSIESPEENKNAREINDRPIKRMVRTLLRRTLSLTTFQVLGYRSWCLKSYIPRLFTSKIVNRNPEVRCFGALSAGSDLEKELKSVKCVGPDKDVPRND